MKAFPSSSAFLLPLPLWAASLHASASPTGTGNRNFRLQQTTNLGVGAGGTGSTLSQFTYGDDLQERISAWTQLNSGSTSGQRYEPGYDDADQLSMPAPVSRYAD